MANKLVKPQDAADQLGISLGTFYNWVSARKIEVVKLSKRLVRVRQSVIDRMLDDKTQITAKAES